MSSPAQQLPTTPWPGFARAAIALLGVAVLLVALNQYTDLDLWLADLHFDAGNQRFPWRSTWFSVTLMHGHVKQVLVWAGFLLLGTALVDLLRPLPRLSALRRAQLRILALSALIEPRLVKLIKDYSHLQCPWSVDRYAGSEPLLRILDSVPAGFPSGDCFPAGHASVAMWLVALAVLWLPHAPHRALAAYLGGLGLGMTLGWVQQMRGAHFLTHTLWTAWIASATLLALVIAFSRQLYAAARPTPHLAELAAVPTPP